MKEEVYEERECDEDNGLESVPEAIYEPQKGASPVEIVDYTTH